MMHEIIIYSTVESNDCCRGILECNISFYLRVQGNNWLHYTVRAVLHLEIFNVDRHRDLLMIYRQRLTRPRQTEYKRSAMHQAAQPRLIALMNTAVIRDDDLNPGELAG